MTNNLKDKILLFEIIKAHFENKNIENADVVALEFIKDVKDKLDFERAQEQYRTAAKAFRKKHKDE